MSTPRKKRATKKTVPVTAPKRAPVLNQPSILTEVRELILTARERVAQAVNAGLTMLYWQIGTRIRQDILKEKRAEYGEEILQTLSARLLFEFFPSRRRTRSNSAHCSTRSADGTSGTRHIRRKSSPVDSWPSLPARGSLFSGRPAHRRRSRMNSVGRFRWAYGAMPSAIHW